MGEKVADVDDTVFFLSFFCFACDDEDDAPTFDAWDIDVLLKEVLGVRRR